MDNDKLKPVRMPVDLAVQLCKAADKDKDAMVELENDIKDVIAQRTALTSTCLKRLSIAS